jgi:hypothetical protein
MPPSRPGVFGEPEGLGRLSLQLVSGDPSLGPATLSSAAPMRLHMHGATTSVFAPPEDWAAWNATVPPPPLKRWEAPLAHRAQALEQRFRVRTEGRRSGLSGLFLGTYSALPFAAPCRLMPRTRHVCSGYAAKVLRFALPHSACTVLPYATALLNSTE